MVCIILLAEGQRVLSDIGVLHLLDDALVGEVGVALQNVLMVEHQLIEDGGAVDADGPADDGSVGVEPYLLALADDTAHEQREQPGGGVVGVLTQERRSGKVRQQREEGVAYPRGSVGVRTVLVTDAFVHGTQLLQCLCRCECICHIRSFPQR